jgi:hypothetical protein
MLVVFWAVMWLLKNVGWKVCHRSPSDSLRMTFFVDCSDCSWWESDLSLDQMVIMVLMGEFC